jgi:hypothetical protein
MEIEKPAIEQVTEIVGEWPGVTRGTGERGELSFRFHGREIGHLHGSREAHFFLDRSLAISLRAAGRVTPHPVFPKALKLAARRIVTVGDIADVVEIFRLNYERIAGAFVAAPAAMPEALRH